MKTEHYTASGVRVLRGMNISDDGRIEGDFVYVSEKFADSLGNARLRPGDIALPHRGAIGKAALIKDDDLAMSTSLMRVRIDTALADPRFVAAFLNSSDGKREILQFASTVGTPGIGQPLTSLRQVKVPHPPLDQQHRIAAVICALDDLIQVNRLVAARTRDLSRTLYKRLTVRSLPDTQLGEVARISDLKVKPSTGSLRYIDIAAMGDGSVDLPSSIDWSEAPSRARMKATRGSTLWSTVRPNRRAHALLVEAPEDLVVSTGIAVLRPDSIGPAELFAATDQDEFVDQLTAKADGSAYPAVRPSAFAEVRIAALDAQQSTYFERVMWPLWLDAHAATQDAVRLSHARDVFVPLLMSGQVRVSEALAVA